MSNAPDPSTPLSREERFAYELGRRCFERGDITRALTYLERLLETRRGFADVHYMVGSLYERRDDLEAAERSFEEALRINPAYTEALLALASLLERRGNYAQSGELCERAARSVVSSDGIDRTTRGKLANLQAELADALREAGELGEAVEAYRKALERCPEFHDIRYRLGIALREAGRPDRALAEFRRVQAANPGFLEARIQLGVTLYTLGRSPEAVEAWESVLQRQPTHPDAQMYLRLVGGPAPVSGSLPAT
jgi:tetratricopeptide (TPR) repeat protein